MFSAERQIFLCANGTIFGREVVPEVCNTNAISSDSAKYLSTAESLLLHLSVNVPASDLCSGESSIIGMPLSFATSMAGEFVFD